MGQTSTKHTNAICVIRNNQVNGVIKINEINRHMVHITGQITGLSPGLHGFHIHRCGNLEKECDSCCDHYNPHGKKHGGPNSNERHVGDLGNIKANKQGIAIIDQMDHLVKLSGPYSVIGRSFVVHESEDDLGQGTGKLREESYRTGNAGKRIGCGVIGIDE